MMQQRGCSLSGKLIIFALRNIVLLPGPGNRDGIATRCDGVQICLGSEHTIRRLLDLSVELREIEPDKRLIDGNPRSGSNKNVHHTLSNRIRKVKLAPGKDDTAAPDILRRILKASLIQRHVGGVCA